MPDDGCNNIATFNTFYTLEGIVSQCWHCTYSVSLQRFRVKVVVVQKQGISYSECLSVALVIQQSKRVRRFTLPSVACPAVLYICTLSHKWNDFRGGVGGGIKFVF